MRTRLLATLLLAAAPAVANVHPNMERGFDPDAAFQTGEIDSVSLFNGSLTLAIPIGPRLPVKGGFSYGLTLTYNSNVWEFQEVLELVNGQWELKTEAFASKFWNAGLGWRLSLGEFVDKNDSIKNQTDKWMYVGPDGSAHVFYQQLHETEDDGTNEVLYTRDGSYLRLVAITGLPFSTWKRIEFPDGTLHTFNKATGLTWRLTKIEDRFGNYIAVSYQDGIGASEWQITDSHGRLTRVLFEQAMNLPQRVGAVIVPKFGGGTATWDFHYVDDHRGISDKDNYGGNNDRPQFSLLTKIDLPDNSYYEMLINGEPAYNDEPCGTADCPGTIQRLRLPSGGRLEWTYQAYDYPQGPKGWLNTTTGVLERKMVDKNGNDAGTWTYANKRWRESPSEPYDEVHTYVTIPAGTDGVRTCAKHYFTTPPDLEQGQQGQPWKGWEYGLPFSWRQSQGTGADERFISTELYPSSIEDGEGDRVCSGTKAVSTFLRFAHDRLPPGTNDDDKPGWYNSNRRAQIQGTRYDSDAGRSTKTTYSNFDGIGHYRQVVVGGDLENGDYPWSPITTVTDYYRSAATYDIDPETNAPTLQHNYTLLPPSTVWVLGVFKYQKTTDSGVTWGPNLTQTNFSFDDDTGFLECIRRLRAGVDRGPNDVVELFDHDSSGNISMHRVYGGDAVTLPTDTDCDTAGAFASRVKHTYLYGSRATSKLWKLPGPAEFEYFSFNAQIDPSTGLVSLTTDPQGDVTEYTYDALGRPTSVEVEDLADTVYTYTNVTPGGQAKISIDQENSAENFLTRSEIRFDDFGRPVLRRQRRPGQVWSEQKTIYDKAGRVSEVSVPGDTTKTTKYLDFDILGRPRTIRPPDAPLGEHDMLLTYAGVRQVDTELSVATSETQETYRKRRELYDNAGRLRKVVEFADEGSAEIKTEYRYDAGGRLSWISQNHGLIPNQLRRFTYDNRGFLLEEWHPEKGPTMGQGGWVEYSAYDGAGRVGEILDGANTLSFTYDYAGRVTAVRHLNQQNRLLKEFVYDVNESTWGKLYQATRHNYDPSSGADAPVTETYTYGDDGLVSQRTTAFGGALSYTFSQTFAWTELGQVASLTYPTCTAGSCSGLGAGVGNVTATYADGLLQTVTGWTTGSIQYHLNGMWAEVPHSNGTTDSQALENTTLPRPLQLTTTKGTPVLWDSGTFAYDGAGNVKTLGPNKFTYDSVNRLLQGQVQGWTQSYVYDRFGNMVSRTTTPPQGQGSPVTVNFGIDATRNRLSAAAYDDAGNMTNWPLHAFTYDPVNQLVQLAASDGTWRYLYTAADERAAAIRNDAGNIGYAFYIRDLNGQLLTHFRRVGPDAPASWTRVRDYVRAGGRLLGSSGTEGVRHYHPDHLGTPRIVTDAAGEKWAAHDYLPYGEEITDPQQNQLDLKYTAHERDKHGSGSADDIDYMHARYYGVHLARFSTPDVVRGVPSAPQSLHRYAYTRGNPLKYTDPTGEIVVLFTGWLDKPGGVTQLGDLLRENPPPGLGSVHVLDWEDGDKGSQLVQSAYRADASQLVVVGGHSHGGWTALTLAQSLDAANVPVDILITIDPVKHYDVSGQVAVQNYAVAANVFLAINYYQDENLTGGNVLFSADASSGTVVLNFYEPGAGHTTIDETVAAVLNAMVRTVADYLWEEALSLMSLDELRSGSCILNPLLCGGGSEYGGNGDETGSWWYEYY